MVGDDLLVTNPKRVKQGIDGKWCNALLLKVNQIGSLTESINAVRLRWCRGPCAVHAGKWGPPLLLSTYHLESVTDSIVPVHHNLCLEGT